MEENSKKATARWGPSSEAAEEHLRSFTLTVIDGDAPQTWSGGTSRCQVGSLASNDLVLAHPSVSRLHCELTAGPEGARVVDRGSLNGTCVNGVVVRDALLRDGMQLRLGAVTLLFQQTPGEIRLPLWPDESYGDLVGRSPAMRHLFSVVERCASSEATVLIEGETGTGKEGVAESLHARSARAQEPFMVVDCAALPPTLLESELFGHERGAFTGAHARRAGAFEAARGGTVLLDEVGELPLEFQPRLLRVLEQRTVRRVGSNERVPVDVRIVAATHRSLHAAVNAGSFRSDLYYRLAVVKVDVPPLRERLEDLPLLVEALLRGLGATAAQRTGLLEPGHLRRLMTRDWPGNVRELRNHLERALVLGVADEPAREESQSPPPSEPDLSLGWSEARAAALRSFERRYLVRLLAEHADNVSKAARAAGLDRVHLHRLLRRDGLR